MTTLASAPRPSTPSPTPRVRRAGAYLLGLVWGLPLIAFTVAYALAEETGMDDSGRSLVAIWGIFVAVLLIPLGLLALLGVWFLAAMWRDARPIVLAAVC